MVRFIPAALKCRSERRPARRAAGADPRPQERGDAARNRALLLDAARRLIAERGADAVTMDDIAAAAGVGKGTVFRRFGSRAGLMMVLLDEDERASQQAFLFGPPPLGPGAPPLDRLLAFGRERLRFVHDPPRAALGGQPRSADPLQRAGDAAAHATSGCCWSPRAPPATSTRRPTRCWRCSTPTTSQHQLTDRGADLETLGDAWESLARKLCGTMTPRRWILHVDLDQFLAVGRSAPPPRTRRPAGHRRRQRRSDRAAQGRHLRVVPGARVRRARRDAAAHRGAQVPRRDVPAARTPPPTTRRPKR